MSEYKRTSEGENMSEPTSLTEFKERRKLDEDQIRSILDVIRDHELWVDAETHRCHHDFVAQLIAKEERKMKRWDKIKEQVTAWAVIAVLGAIGSAVYNWLIHLKDHTK